jgi:polar amino acid transport system substrate-binding protein
MVDRISMGKFLPIVLLIAFLVTSSTQAETLKLVANYWEPYTGQGLDNQGVAADIVRTALGRAGYDIEIHIEPWARALHQVNHGHYDGLVAVWRTRDRDATLVLSDAYFNNRIVLIARRDRNFQVGTIDDLTNRTIGVGRGYDYTDAFARADTFVKEAVTTADQNLKKLSAGRIDLMIEDRCIAKFNMRLRPKGFDFDRDLEIISPPIFEIPLYFGLSRQYPDHDKVMQGFNRALAAMMRDGTYQALLLRHRLGDC